jgi:hypothetical protein
MIRKDPAQDMDRPHFYSQFWIDVASGKRDVSETHAADTELIGGDELDDEELAAPPTEVLPKPAAKKPTKPEKKPEPARPTITSLADLANIDLLMKNSAEMEGDEVPDLEAGAIDDLAPFGQTDTAAEPAAPSYDFEEEEPQTALNNEEEEFEDLDFDEDEEEDEWGGRRPGKPGKQQQKPRRDRERDRRPNF